MNGWGIGFKACGDQLIVIVGGSKSYTGGMIELCAWFPDEQPPVWNLITKHPSGNVVYNAAVMSC
jgi:proline racemase